MVMRSGSAGSVLQVVAVMFSVLASRLRTAPTPALIVCKQVGTRNHDGRFYLKDKQVHSGNFVLHNTSLPASSRHQQSEWMKMVWPQLHCNIGRRSVMVVVHPERLKSTAMS